jgi:hypothetical protein
MQYTPPTINSLKINLTIEILLESIARSAHNYWNHVFFENNEIFLKIWNEST